MVSVELIDTTIRATDRVANVSTIQTVGWDEPAPSLPIPMQLDAAVSGRAAALSTDAAFPEVSEIEAGERTASRQIDAGTSVVLDDGSHMVHAEGPLITHFRFDGAATVTFTENDVVRLSFEQPKAVTIGFVSRVSYPRHTITVPRTPEGVATGLSHFAAAVQERDARRTANMNLRHPPRLAFGDELDVPHAVGDHVPETGLVLRLPSQLEYLFPAAPLAYYLGARIELDDEAEPALATRTGSVLTEFGTQPGYQYAVAGLLRRVFLLDMLVRYDQYSSANPADLDLLSALDADTDVIRERTDPERLEALLALDFDRISNGLPEWHFASFVEPTFENVRALPYLIRNVSAIYLPDAARPGRDRAADHAPYRRVPKTIPGRVVEGGRHGSSIAWLCDDPPPAETMFRPDPDVYEHASRFIDRTDADESVVVVGGAETDAAILAALRSQYDTHTAATVSVEVHEAVTRDELAAIFETGADFVHFVGNVANGFACTDGTLAPAELDRSNVRLCLLDGPSGRDTGLECVRRGSAAGIVRDGHDRPLDAETRERLVGLLTRGFTLDQAVRYATAPGAAASFMAVGDAFLQLTQSMKLYATPATIDPVRTDRFAVDAHVYIPLAGFIWRPELHDVPAEFCNRSVRFSATGPELETLVETQNIVPIVDGIAHWDDTEPLFYPYL
ncbi:hypothetical protein C479_05113 [Halovivax asiaticus JCM 14624]|uniref:Uncharacterized protein n=1 Tax=Halovivax asiaticus JCM 14624 TaxID=1227490 RepID=M0BMS5_9EURY|nr:hypothetical protein [Halovivax asiaticus]ELZ12160.1 hypothetical protein C479_05113 [Halovivax asiaticus JCM 14624]